MDSNYDLSKTRYTHRDYESIKKDLIDAIPSLTQEWTSREESDPGIVLIKLMSMFGDTLSYNVDKIALELYIQSVTQRKNCSKILRLLGYKMHWYRSGRVMAHVRLISSLDLGGNLGHVILYPYKTKFYANDIVYTVVGQEIGSDQIDIFSDMSSVDIKLVQGEPIEEEFTKDSLINNRYYFGNSRIDETEILLEVDKAVSSKVVCKLTESLYLVSSSSTVYYEFDVDEFDRPYIQLADGWEDIVGADDANFKVTYLKSNGSLGNISSNAFTEVRAAGGETPTSNLVVTNLTNTSKYGDSGDDLEAYNSPGYNPQTVDDARRDSANYVFTHDTLVTSSDFEKACKRVDGITVSKLVDGQVILNDGLDLNDICTRALDRFSKVYVEEESINVPEVIELNEYLLAYQVILYLAYGNFDKDYNDYYKLHDRSFWHLPEEELTVSETDPYSSEYWEPYETGSANGESSLELSRLKENGPLTDITKGVEVRYRVTINEKEITHFTYEIKTVNGELCGVINIPVNAPVSVRDIVVNEGSNRTEITHLEYLKEEKEDSGTITIKDNYPDKITTLVVNTSDYPGASVDIQDKTAYVKFEPDDQGKYPIGDVKVRRLYYKTSQKIEFKSNAPENITSLSVGKTKIEYYDYVRSQTENDKERTGTLTFETFSEDPIESIFVNGSVGYTSKEFEVSTISVRQQSPGYYPFKLAKNIQLSVIELLKRLQVLNVKVDFGTLKVFPFKVEGTLHLAESFSPAEILQIVTNVNQALEQAYHPAQRDKTSGEKPNFIELVDIIQGADIRIKYFDAERSIVEWAPEVQKRIDDFDKIFDTTSSIMYNGLSRNFNVGSRFLRFRFKNIPVTMSEEEESLLVTEGTESGSYCRPTDYGTAYLVNYSRVAEKPYIEYVHTNNYLDIQLDSVEELRALCDDLRISGQEWLTYIRHFSPQTEDDKFDFDEDASTSGYEVVDTITADGKTSKFATTSLNSNSVYRVKVNGVVVNNPGLEIEEDTYTFNLTKEVRFKSTDQIKVDKNIKVLSVLVNEEEISSDSYEYNTRTGIIILDSELDGNVVIVTTYPRGTTVTVEKQFSKVSFNKDSQVYIDEIRYSGELTLLKINDEEYGPKYFDNINSGVINKETNPEIFDMINLNSDLSITYGFKFGSSKFNLSIDTRRYEDVVDIGTEKVPEEDKIDKLTLINNTGLQWIKER